MTVLARAEYKLARRYAMSPSGLTPETVEKKVEVSSGRPSRNFTRGQMMPHYTSDYYMM